MQRYTNYLYCYVRSKSKGTHYFQLISYMLRTTRQLVMCACFVMIGCSTHIRLYK